MDYRIIFLIVLNYIEIINCGILPFELSVQWRKEKPVIVNLSHKNLTKVRKDLFKNRGAINILHLEDCNLSVIDETTFSKMTSLMALNCRENQIEYLNQHLFVETKQIIMIDFSRNKIRQILGSVFSYLKCLEEVNLESNAIEYIDKKAFIHCTNLTTLLLGYNNLKYLTPLWNIDRLDTLDLYKNPLMCDCKLNEFAEWIRSRSLAPARCADPPGLKDVKITSQKLSDCQIKFIDITYNFSDNNCDGMQVMCKIEKNKNVEVIWKLDDIELGEHDYGNDTDEEKYLEVCRNDLVNTTKISCVIKNKYFMMSGQLSLEEIINNEWSTTTEILDVTSPPMAHQVSDSCSIDHPTNSSTEIIIIGVLLVVIIIISTCAIIFIYRAKKQYASTNDLVYANSDVQSKTNKNNTNSAEYMDEMNELYIIRN